MIDENTEPDPQKPRKRWRKTKWFYGILVAYCAVTIAAVIWWSGYSHRKFREVADPIVARGQPLAWSDFATDPIPDDQNAAVLYKQAVEGGVLKDADGLWPSEFSSRVEPWRRGWQELVADFASDRELRLKYPKELRKLLGMARETFACCRKARMLDKIDWGIDFNGDIHEILVPPALSLYIHTANLLHLAAIEAHEAGRDDDAVEYICDIVSLGDRLAPGPNIITYLVGLAVNATANRAIEDIVATMKIGDAPGCASVESIRRLCAKYLDRAPFDKGIIMAMMGERSLTYELYMGLMKLDFPTRHEAVESDSSLADYYSRSPFIRVLFDNCIAPAWRIDAARAIEHYNSCINAFGSGTLPEYRRRVKQAGGYADEVVEVSSFLRPLSTMTFQSFNNLCNMHYCYLARRRMAGVMLAVRMHQIDRGSLPDTLDQLVPDYLAKIPDDPTDEPGSQIRYVKDPKAPRLCCVGLNGRDDGGAYDDFAETHVDRKEVLFFLSGRPETPEAETDPDQ